MPDFDSVEGHMASEYFYESSGIVQRADDPRNKAPEWFIDYVLAIRDAVGLRDWSLWIIVDDLGENLAGRCSVTYGRRLANIYIDAKSLVGSVSELRATVVHELIHCHMSPVNWAFTGVGKQVMPAVFTAIQDAFIDAEELAIDNMAMAWATRLPLPRPPEAKQEEVDNEVTVISRDNTEESS